MRTFLGPLFLLSFSGMAISFSKNCEPHESVVILRNTVDSLLRNDNEHDLQQAKQRTLELLNAIRSMPQYLLAEYQLMDDFVLVQFLYLRIKYEIAQLHLSNSNNLHDITPREWVVDHYRKKILVQFSNKKLQKKLKIGNFMKYLAALESECNQQTTLLSCR